MAKVEAIGLAGQVLRNKFVALRDHIVTQLVGRDEIVEGMICAALAGEHVLLLGPPGTAKSALANAFTSSVKGAEIFTWLLSKFSNPEEIFGPISLQALKQDSYRRVTAGKLPEAHVAFLDEIFKANSAILNTLLTAINERKFHNNGGAADIPLRLVVGASNELPEGPELAALYDRFLLRYWVDYVTTPDDFMRVLQSAEPQGKELVTLTEWDAARAQVSTVTVSEDLARTLYRLRSALEKHSIRLSDRRWKRCVKLVQANAWMSGETEALDEHCAPLADALWDVPDQRTAVAEEVQKITASVVGEARDLVQAFTVSIQALQNSKDEDQQQKLVSLSRESQRVAAKLREIAGKARSEPQKRTIVAIEADFEAMVAPIKQRTRAALGL